MRIAKVYMYETLAGILTENDEGYHFKYDDKYLKKESAEPISITMPITNEVYSNKILFPFFDGLIPEGWLLDIATKNWKIDIRDRMGLLLVTCRDCIGAVSIEELKEKENV
jgi:serine/threonine-protein kinase HipA